jgi:hypothetical protein
MDSETGEVKRFVVNMEGLPPLFPTHQHSNEFWEHLGRTVATFGFLEEVLKKAIFSFTGNTLYSQCEIDAAYERWALTLEKVLTAQLSNLIDAYDRAVRNHPDASVLNFDELLNNLREVSRLRNVLCHGSWRFPEASGKSLPLFVNKQTMVFDTPIDIGFLQRTQKAVAELACHVVTSVTLMGWQFPGTKGPGKPIF